MDNTLIQVRINKKLKADATDIYEKLGLDLPTAIRIFLTRSVQEKGIPFNMTLKDNNYKAEEAVMALRQLSKKSEEKGLSNLTLDEINAEIYSYRNEE